MIIRRARTIGNALRHYTGEVRGPGGGKFSEREHAQEEQYFRKKEREEIERYREELEKASHKKDSGTPKQPSSGKGGNDAPK